MAEWFGIMWSNIMDCVFGGNETDIKPVEPVPIPEPFPSESEDVILTYDAERNEWLHQGDIIVNGKVVVNNESE